MYWLKNYSIILDQIKKKNDSPLNPFQSGCFTHIKKRTLLVNDFYVTNIGTELYKYGVWLYTYIITSVIKFCNFFSIIQSTTRRDRNYFPFFFFCGTSDDDVDDGDKTHLGVTSNFRPIVILNNLWGRTMAIMIYSVFVHGPWAAHLNILTYTHTDVFIYIFELVCVCVCICVYAYFYILLFSLRT